MNGVLPANGTAGQVHNATLVEDAGRDGDNYVFIIENNQFVGYTRPGSTTTRVGTAPLQGAQYVAETYGDKGVIGISRWAGGTGILGSDRGATQGDHYLFGTLATALPASGVFLFNVGAYTQPTIRNAATTTSGSVTGQAAIRYVSSVATALGLDIDVTVNGLKYAVDSTGGLTAPALGLNNGNFSIPAPTGGTASVTCASNCEFHYSGFLAGTGGTDYGLLYTIRPRDGATTGRVDGGVIFNNPVRVAQAGGTFTQTFNNLTISGQTWTAQDAPGLTSLVAVIKPDGVRASVATMQGGTGGQRTEYRADTGIGQSPVTIGTAQNINFGGVAGNVGWTRWNSGTTAGYQPMTIAANQGVHMLWAEPVSGTLPTGLANYELVGGTQPTLADGSVAPGTFKGALAVDFATSKVGWDSLIAIGGQTYNFLSAGGTAAPSVTFSAGNAYRFNGTGDVFAQSGNCGGCTGTANGFLAGATAKAAGFAYVLGTTQGNVSGVAAFERPLVRATTGAPTEPPVMAAFSLDNTLEGVSGTELTATAAGALATLRYGGSSISRGTAKDFDNGGAGGQVGWTRWADGQMNFGTNRTLNADRGGHVVWGVPVSAMPTTGTATYTLAGASKPTNNSAAGTPGSFTGSLGVDFAGMKVGWSSVVSWGGTDYTFNSAGGAAAPSVTLAANGTFFGGEGPGSTQGSARGFLAGAGASHAGMAYMLMPIPNQNVYINGVAAFTKN